MLKNIKVPGVGKEIDADNFSDILSFLRGKFSRKKGKKGIKISSMVTYLFQLNNIYRFASRRCIKIVDNSKEDLKVFTELYPSSIRIVKELLASKKELADNKLEELDLEDPALSPERSKHPEDFIHIDLRGEKFLSLTEVEKIVIVLALELFMRESEIAGCKARAMVDDPSLPGLKIKGKGDKKRFVPFTHSTLTHQLLHIVRHGDDYLVCKSDGKRYTRRGIDKICRSALKKLGLPETHIHFLRHLGITEAILSGLLTLKEASALAGHSHVETTIREYFHGQAIYVLRALEGRSVLNTLFGSETRLLSVKKAASLLNTGERNVQYRCKKGGLKAVKVKGDWLIDETEILIPKLSDKNGGKN